MASLSVVDLGYREVDAANPRVRIKHHGSIRSMTDKDRQHLKRGQTVEPVIGHLIAGPRMARCSGPKALSAKPLTRSWKLLVRKYAG
jgi:hypothetical protein